MGLKVVLITPGQPSVNPRIVKEADALSAAGYEVTMLYCFWIEWAMIADKKLLENVKWNYKLIGGSPSINKLTYAYTKARQKINRLLNKIFGNKFLFAERAQARCYDELLSAAKAMKADWYIAHNLGALAAAVKSAGNNYAKAGFDFEDYHREENENMPAHEIKRIVYLEEKYVSRLQYLSASSTMITGKVQNNFPLFGKPCITLLNCFPLSQQPSFRDKPDAERSISFFWFSQTIGINRGLEIFIKVLSKLNDPLLYLVLAGRYNADFKNYTAKHAGNIEKNITYAGIIEPTALPAFAANFDVGLAIELPVPENRDLCLTNKIFTYLLAGNAILLSETSMQQSFNQKYTIGESFKVNDEHELESKILFYKNKKSLHAQRLHNYQLARQELNWDKEAGKLLSVLN